MTRARWIIFRALSALGWWICPEPYRSALIASMPTWDDIGMTSESKEGKQ